MDEDRDNLLEQTYALTVENNRLLKKMRRGSRIGLVFKLVFWAVMLGLPIWMYFTILEPMLQQGMGVLQQVQGVADMAGTQSQQVKGLLDSIPGLDLLDQFNQ